MKKINKTNKCVNKSRNKSRNKSKNKIGGTQIDQMELVDRS